MKVIINNPRINWLYKKNVMQPGEEAEKGADISVGDCVARALTILSDREYGDVVEDIRAEKERTLEYTAGMASGDSGTKDVVWHKIARDYGFVRVNVPALVSSIKTLSTIYPNALVKVKGHVLSLVDGNIHDSWNSRNHKVKQVWIHREDLKSNSELYRRNHTEKERQLLKVRRHVSYWSQEYRYMSKVGGTDDEYLKATKKKVAYYTRVKNRMVRELLDEVKQARAKKA